MTIRLIIHAGLHKTGSTYFQKLLFLNRAAIRAAGVYVQADAKLQANHLTAWTAQMGDLRFIEAHISQAKAGGFKAMLLSSEDFESLLLSPEICRLVERSASTLGAALEWHVCLRDPGEYLASMYAELSRHGYVDFASYFVHALRDGHVRVPREPGRPPVWWELCLDAGAILRRLASATKAPIRLHDFRDATPYPMHRLVEDLGISAAITEWPGPNAINVRALPEEIAGNIRAALAKVTDAAGLPESSRDELLANRFPSTDLLEACSDAVRRKYGPGVADLLGRGVVPHP